MRTFGSMIGKAVKLHEPPVPGPRLARVNPLVVNRLDEGLSELFNYACVSDDLESAADLVALMIKWHSRRSYSDDQQRQTDRKILKRMCGELERRHIVKGHRASFTPRSV